MDDCCSSKANELAGIQGRQRRVLVWVLAINLVMFFIEGFYGLLARSVSLLADSLDMLGDAFVYAISLYVIGKSTKWNSSISLIKGIIMCVFGLGVFANAIYRYMAPEIPMAQTMGTVGVIALIANLICTVLLLRHRNDDLNMRSTWLCSRNDVLANLGVIIAAIAVTLTRSKYPDLVVGLIIGGIVLKSSFHVLSESIVSLRQT